MEAYQQSGNQILELLHLLQSSMSQTRVSTRPPCLVEHTAEDVGQDKVSQLSAGRSTSGNGATSGRQRGNVDTEEVKGDEEQLETQLVAAVMRLWDSCFDAVMTQLAPADPLLSAGVKGNHCSYDNATRAVACTLQCSIAGWGVEACRLLAALLAQQLLLAGHRGAAISLVVHACGRVAPCVLRLVGAALEALEAAEMADMVRLCWQLHYHNLHLCINLAECVPLGRYVWHTE